jgi:nucleotide-binding universal stress UspA family protein
MGLAKALSAKITVLMVLTPFPVFTSDAQAVEDTEPEYMQRMEASRTKLLATIGNAAKAAGVPCETVKVSHEHRYEAIIDMAKTKECDLIAMAAGKRDGEGTNAFEDSGAGV